MILQPCLANNGRLKISISLIPSPPSRLQAVIFFQLIQEIFCFSFCPDHQKFRILEVISLRIPLGSRKHDIAYVGNAVITAFNKTSLPAGLKNLLYQLSNLFITLCLMYSKASFLLRPIFSGSPKHFLLF